MVPENKGIYPSWVNDKDIIDQILHEIIEGGKLPYSFVINPEHTPETQERMKNILKRMQKEKLIICPESERGFIEAAIEGGRAIQLGYRKYRRVKRWRI